MKQKRLLSAGIILLAAFAVIFILGLGQRELKLNYIEQVHYQDGYLYYVDRGESDYYQIIRSDVNGKQGDVIQCPRYKDTKYRTIRQLFFDDAGAVYILLEEIEAAAFQKTGCAVFRCDFDSGRLAETEYDFTEILNENQDICVQGLCGEEAVFFTLKDNRAKEGTVTVNTMKRDGTVKEIDSVSIKYPYLKNQFFFSRNHVLLWMDHKGEVFAKKAGKDSYLKIEGITGVKNTFRSLSNDDEFAAYVVDYKADCIRSIDLKEETSDVICTAEEIKEQGEDFSFVNLVNPDCTKTGFCAGEKKGTGKDDEVSIFTWHKGVYRDIERITLTPRSIIHKLLPVYMVIIAAALFLCVYWYVYCMKHGKTILVRLLLVFLIGLLAADHELEQWIDKTIRERLEKNQAMALTILGEHLREDIMEQLEKDPESFPAGAESWMANQEGIGKSSGDSEANELMVYQYSILKANKKKELLVSESMSEYSGVPAQWSYSAASCHSLCEAYDSGKCREQLDENEDGKWNNRFIPLILSDGTSYGVLTVSVPGDFLDYQIWQYQSNLKTVSRVLILVLSIILLIILYLFLRPLKKLKEGAGRLAEGEMGVNVPVRGHDEIADITRTFNQMSLGIARHVKDMKDMSDGYYKFIPAKILELLGKDSIQQVKLGDEMTGDMTILSLHAANFIKQKQHKAPGTVFEDINRMLAVPVAAIGSHHGVVEHFEDEGLSAFFTVNSHEALDAAIEIHRSLDERSHGNERTIAISYGKVMIGVIGFENRMEASTISIHSNLAKALRLRGSDFGARILVTHLVYRQIQDFEKHYHARYLGNIRLDGNGMLERIYDVYDGDSEDDFYYKELTKELFEQGVELFVAKKFYEARLVFVEVLKQYRKDKAAKEYLYRCDKYYKLKDDKDTDTVIGHF